MKKLVIVLGLLGAALPAAAQQPALRIRLGADARTLDPGTNRDAITDAIQTNLFEGLVAFRDDSSVGPVLAKSVAVSEDGKTYTFVLRDGVKFSNGAPLTTKDVLFAWQRYTDPKTGWRCLSEVDGRGAVKVTGITAPDDRTVVFKLEKPSALFLATLARPDCGGTGIFHSSSLNPDGSWREPVTTGPYKLGEWKRGQFIRLLANEHYTAGPGPRDGLTGDKTPLVAQVDYLVIPDEATAKAALLSNGIDINWDIATSDLQEYRSRQDIVIESVPTMSISDLLIQTKDPLLSDVRMRQAILLSLDLETIADEVTGSQSKASHSPIPRSSAYHKAKQAASIHQDIPAAKKLLMEAGYRGQVIKLLANKRYPEMFDQAILVQAMAKEAGINIEVEVVDWGVQQDRYLAGNYQMMSHSFSARLDPSLSFEMFTGEKATQPRKAWDSKAAADLVTRSMAIADPAQRQAIFDKLEDMYRADIPMITLFSGTRLSASRSNIEGYRSWALGTPRPWGVSIKR